MSALDWIVLVGTLGFIGVYGVVKNRRAQDAAEYLRASNSLSWPTIGLGIMATQASAITFLSTPGQGYEDGLRFVQFYFGLPLAMIVISAYFVPIYYKLKVYTAYEVLEHRFDVRVRVLGAALFLVQRGLAAGITIYAPSIILSTLMGWSLELTILVNGAFVIIYTVLGGQRAVAQTQKQQMAVMLGGMVVVTIAIVGMLPDAVSVPKALQLAGALGRVNPVSFELSFADRYNFWSGITGGFFLALSYFGTDQSQVGRYLSGKSVAESRLGLLFNGLFKIPMQLGILFAGLMVFVFHMFVEPPVVFNAPLAAKGAESAGYVAAERAHREAFEERKLAAERFVAGEDTRPALVAAQEKLQKARVEAKAELTKAVPGAATKDADYIFISFVLRYLPAGLVGLLVAVILCAAMSSTASELSALGTTTTMDLYKRARKDRAEDAAADVRASKAFTALWGVVALAFAAFASLVDNLIQAVNIMGSIFYGTVLGIFVVAFFLKRVGATPVLIGAAVAQVTVLALFFGTELGFLWYNVVGCGIVVAVSLLAQAASPSAPAAERA